MLLRANRGQTPSKRYIGLVDRAAFLADSYVRLFLEWVQAPLCAEGRFVHRYSRADGRPWHCTSLFDAFHQGDGHGEFSANVQQLNRLTRQLRAALAAGDAGAFHRASTAALRPGAAAARTEARLRRLGPSLIGEFRAAARQLRPRTARTDRLDRVPRFSSSYARLFALVVSGWPQYDSRIGAGLGLLVRRFCESAGLRAVAPLLQFAHGGTSERFW